MERGGTHVFDEEAVLGPFEQQRRLLAQHEHDLPHSKTRHQSGEYRRVHLGLMIRQCLGMRALCCLSIYCLMPRPRRVCGLIPSALASWVVVLTCGLGGRRLYAALRPSWTVVANSSRDNTSETCQAQTRRPLQWTWCHKPVIYISIYIISVSIYIYWLQMS